MVILGAVLMAFTVNTFVHAGGLIPGGFTGLTLLIQEIGQRYLGIHIPFSIVFYALNAVCTCDYLFPVCRQKIHTVLGADDFYMRTVDRFHAENVY